MGKTNAEKQRAYRERMKARLGEEFLKKERERVKKARTPAALLNKKELQSGVSSKISGRGNAER